MDGFIASVGHTIVVGGSKVSHYSPIMVGGGPCVSISHSQDNKVTGRQADVIMAGYLAAEIAHRMLVPGGHVRERSDKQVLRRSYLPPP